MTTSSAPPNATAWQSYRVSWVQTRLVRPLRRMPVTGLAGGAILAVFTLATIFAPLVATHDPNTGDTLDRLLAPSADHWFGTDQIGRDIFSRVVWGALHAGGQPGGGDPLGDRRNGDCRHLGLLRGKVDLVIQRLVDAWIAFPAFVLLIALISLLGPNIRNVIIVMSLAMAGTMSRVLRANVIAVKAAGYIETARVSGATDLRIMVFHVLPQIIPLVLILASVQLGGVILSLAALGFLGFGIPPPTPEWGSMLSGRAREYTYSAYWLGLFPGLAITITVLSLTLFFDSLRDVLDPRMRGAGRF
ncbi:MAG: ABC transporter permease [Dehalococcoidia bacterium]|nr:ABC transporter permease [Dehalococcoidia bacterium]